jgi:CheY-like chemotaxis protein
LLFQGRIVMTRARSHLDNPSWSGPPPPTFSVLIADEDDRFRDLVRRHLGHTLMVVGDAADGDEAVRLARRLRPDVVLMEMAMALAGGAEAARRIKDERAQTKVILLTSGPEQWEMTGTEAAGAALLHADAFLRKENVRACVLSRTCAARVTGGGSARRRKVRR